MEYNSSHEDGKSKKTGAGEYFEKKMKKYYTVFEKEQNVRIFSDRPSYFP